jgi:hypothetical protein
MKTRFKLRPNRLAAHRPERFQPSACVILIACFVVAACAAHGDIRFTARNSDLAVLADTLEDAHPNLYFDDSATAFHRAVKNANVELPAHAPPSHTFRILAPIVAGLGDAHTALDPYTSDYRNFRDSGGRLFPLELRFEASKAIVIANYEGALFVPKGSVVLSIAGESIPQFLGRLEKFTSGERPELKAWQLSQDLRAIMWLEGFRAPFSIRIRTPDGRIINGAAKGCTIDAIHAWDRSNAGYEQLADYDFRLDTAQRIGILTIHSFNTDNAQDWDRFLQQMMRRLRDSKAKELVIDIRQNGGGDTTLSDDLLKRFATRPFRDFSEVDIKVSSVVKNALGHDRYVDIYGDDAWNAANGGLLREFPDYENPLPPTQRFHGKVYIITGSGTYSTAAIFAAAAQSSQSATIVGQTSGGLATLYGEAFSFTLPESKINATVSTKYLIAADGNRALHPVRPEKTFVETPLGVRDTELADILRYVSAQ